MEAKQAAPQSVISCCLIVIFAIFVTFKRAKLKMLTAIFLQGSYNFETSSKIKISKFENEFNKKVFFLIQ